MIRKFINFIGPLGFFALYGLIIGVFSMPFIYGAGYLWHLDEVLSFVLFAALLFLLPGLGMVVISIVSYYGLRHGLWWGKYEAAIVFLPFVLPLIIGIPMAVINHFLEGKNRNLFR